METVQDTCHQQRLDEAVFCFFILAFDLYRSWRRTFCPVFLSAVRAVAARCKLPFALRPGLSQEIEGAWTKLCSAGLYARWIAGDGRWYLRHRAPRSQFPWAEGEEAI